jgi:tRNA(Ile2) C34 agmatinyltransferase TiaS
MNGQEELELIDPAEERRRERIAQVRRTDCASCGHPLDRHGSGLKCQECSRSCGIDCRRWPGWASS